MTQESFQERLDLFLKDNCTGSDDHDYKDCKKCLHMKHSIIELLKESLPKEEIPTQAEINSLTEKNISLAVEAVKFHARNSYRTELLRRWGIS